MAITAVTERVSRAVRHTRLFAVTLLATVLVTELSLPWRLAGLGFGAVAVFAGIRLSCDLNALRRGGRPMPGRIAVIAGIVVTACMMVVLMGEAALYPLVAGHERCLARAITHQDQQQCGTDYERRQQQLLRRFERPATTR